MSSLNYSVFVCMALGYLVGGLNPAFLMAKAKGFDIRSRGSGNAGASNAVILMGKSAGLFCALFDIFKAYFIFKLTMRLYPLYKILPIIAGVCCILGHMFPIAMNFRGGKGLATLGGVILAYSPVWFAILIFTELCLAIALNYICVVAPSASLIFMIILFVNHGAAYAIAFLPVVIAIFYRHMDNFKRIYYGVEARFSFLWNKQNEENRVRENWNRLTDDEKLYVNMVNLD